MQIFLTYYYLGGAVDKVLAAGSEFLAEPAGAAFFEDLKEEVGLAFEAEADTPLQLVEDEAVGVIVGIVAVEGGFDFLADRVGERDASGVSLQKLLYLNGEEVGVSDEQLAVLFLPFVAVRGR